MDLDDAARLARVLLARHGLDDWQLRFDRARTRAGTCDARRRTIGLSAPLTALHDEAEVRETLLHEIAHALVGPQHGHDATWRRTALAIGSTGERCLSPDAPAVPGAWQGTCPAGHVTERHRRPTRVVACSRCNPAFDPSAIFRWTHHGRTVPMHPAYEAELERLRTGRRVRRLAPGTTATVPRVRGAGRWAGARVVVASVGRTRYTVTLSDGSRATVPFAWLDEAAG